MLVIILIFSLRDEKIYYVSGSESSQGKLTNNHFGKTILECMNLAYCRILKLSNDKICKKNIYIYITVRKISKTNKNFNEPFFKVF